MAFALAFHGTFRRYRDVAAVTEVTYLHEPVMVEEVLDLLPLSPGGVAVDGTLGLGGHSMRFAQRVAPGGTLLATEWDESMYERATARLASVKDVEVKTRRDDFRNLPSILKELNLHPNGILFDLGLNSAQVDDPTRGISFQAEGPLDMRMDRTKGETAASLLNRMSPREIEDLLFENGERWARAIAKSIVERRKENPLRTTKDLVDAILAAVPKGARDKRINPATKTFQAIRIAVNRELNGLEEAFTGAAESLAKGGVVAILSYHSGEDAIAKNVFRELAATGKFEEVTRKPLRPSEAEVQRNPRSRSARLRALRRIGSGSTDSDRKQ
ncbi:MAG: 16S rRNA (cytosine(1402)-N(4))-methyltransferase RsmH [Armatimonadetes bacterium]|nr:16S rRNA (cytosine(1402)-N(4))-methyltransferase RsmH [Armatimonadota bacterium]